MKDPNQLPLDALRFAGRPSMVPTLPSAGGYRVPESRENPSTVAPNLRGRWGPTIPFNAHTLRGATSVSAATCLRIKVDRPSIVRGVRRAVDFFPAGTIDGVVLPTPNVVLRHQLHGIMLYMPAEEGGSPRALANLDLESSMIQAVGPGVAYLHAPGEWWLAYKIPVDDVENQLAVFVQPAEDPGVAAAALSEPGFQLVTQSTVTLPAVINSPGTLAVANRYRKVLTIQSRTGANLAVGLSEVTLPNAGIATSFGLHVANNGTLTLSGPTAWRGTVLAASDVASHRVLVVEMS